MKKILIYLALAGVLASASVPAVASLVVYTDRATFEAQGTITYNYGFEEYYAPAGYTSLSDPYTKDGVTYKTGGNFVIGPNSQWKPLSNAFIYEYWSPIPADIDAGPAFDMFGFDMGYISWSGVPTVDVVINTNLGSYSYLDQVVPATVAGSTFFGYQAGVGEHFTGFDLSCDTPAIDRGPVIDNVTLGHASVPEPATLSLLALGGLGLLRQRRKK